jgi:hypothetical protein
MALSKQNFTKSWTNSDDFPTFLEDEAQVRADMQELHTQMQSFVNQTLTEELDALLASKVPLAGLSLQAVNNLNGTLTLSLRSGASMLASAVLNIGEAENVTNTYITNELYVNYGWIADLMVNRLRTDWERSARYLASDTTPLHYIDIHDEQIRFITATTDGTSSSQLSYNGRLYWWTDASRTRLTTEETAYPALGYNYTELVKLAFEFREVSLADGSSGVMPVLVLGAGAGGGEYNGKALIYKDTTGLRIKYYAESGVPVSLEMDNGGDIKKRVGSVCGSLPAALTYDNLTVPASAWEADSTWADYPYRAGVSCNGVTAAMSGEVIFHPSAVKAYSLSPVAVTGEGCVYLYAETAPSGEVNVLQLRAYF